MDKINELKEKLALDKHCSPYGKANPETYAFKDGFDAAMQLSPLFAEWTSINLWSCDTNSEWFQNIDDEPTSGQDLFKYWFENIYESEK